jgi:FkbM family methyltransferase
LPIELLDYPKAALRMVVATPYERDMRIRACFKEPDTVRWIETFQEGDVFYDIGANVGSYSLVAAHQGAQVYAFEPEAMNYGRLIQNAGLNEDTRGKIVALPLAAWDKQEILEMHLLASVPGAASHRFEPNGAKEYALQPAVPVSLDELPNYGIPMANHIKIDVDGYEERVLNGAYFALISPQLKSVMCEMDHSDEAAYQRCRERLEDAGLKEVDVVEQSGTGANHFWVRE